MTRTFTSTFTAILIAGAAVSGLTVAPALAAEKDKAPMTRQAAQPDKSQCLANLGKMRDDLARDERFRSAYNAGRIGAGDYRDLVDAARVFARNGMEEKCETVVAGIKELAAKSTTDDQARKPTDDRAAEQRRAAEQKAWQTRYQAAKPVAQSELSVETLNGVDIRNAKGEDLGDVTDIVVANGKVEAVIIGRGGFLGIGTSYYKLSADKARIATMDQDDAGDIVVVVDMAETQLETLPKVTKENGRWIADRDDETKADDKMDKKAQ